MGVRVVVKVSCGIEKSSLGPWKLSSSLYLSSIGDCDIKTLPTMFSCSFFVSSERSSFLNNQKTFSSSFFHSFQSFSSSFASTSPNHTSAPSVPPLSLHLSSLRSFSSCWLVAWKRRKGGRILYILRKASGRFGRG